MRSDMGLLSIVVPALDEAAIIAATLQTLAPLRARGAEIIVVDGGSSDGTAAAIRREMEGRLDEWLKARKTRVTVDDAYVEARTATHKKHGIFFGVW